MRTGHDIVADEPEATLAELRTVSPRVTGTVMEPPAGVQQLPIWQCWPLRRTSS